MGRGRPVGFRMSDEQKKNFREAMARARARKYAGEAPPPDKGQPKKPLLPIAPDALVAPSEPTDIRLIERSPTSKRAKLRSLEAQSATLLATVVGLHKQIKQLVAEEDR